uniref:Uncharacterized protein n=1 Tax=uncultured Alphaproteobacteria bacterium TaxID=91750 RepID=A0A6G8F242_9PROT|nr:hypothetical protein PlAlph_0160 [uncultured Alphaproteobacteria bacterium]
MSPKKAANLLYAEDLGFFSELMEVLNGWMVAMYPFCLKKHFMRVRGLKKYSTKLQCRYYFKVDSSVEVIRLMSDNAVNRLWKTGTSCDKEQIVAAGKMLSVKQFGDLVTNGMSKEMLAYVQRWTPDSNMIHLLITSLQTEVLAFVVKNYGLSAELVEEVFNTKQETLIAAVQDALVVFAHRQVVLNTQRSGDREQALLMWESFCNGLKECRLRSEAQKQMNVWQYEAFHKAGHTLDVDVVEAMFAKGDVVLCTLIFKYEKDNGCVSDKADALVAANPRLSIALLKVRSEQKAA